LPNSKLDEYSGRITEGLIKKYMHTYRGKREDLLGFDAFLKQKLIEASLWNEKNMLIHGRGHRRRCCLLSCR